MHIALIILILATRTFLVEPFTIPSGSMHPTLQVGDQIVVSKFGYGNYDLYGIDILQTRMVKKVERGDVMIFEHPRQPNIQYIKRVVGLPGDHIRMKDKVLHINNVKVNRTPDTGNHPQPTPSLNLSYFTEVIDNSNHTISLSSRHSRIDMDIVVPPKSYFVLGDNRDNSSDSRYWGFVPERNIIGKLAYIFRPTTREE